MPATAASTFQEVYETAALYAAVCLASREVRVKKDGTLWCGARCVPPVVLENPLMSRPLMQEVIRTRDALPKPNFMGGDVRARLTKAIEHSWVPEALASAVDRQQDLVDRAADRKRIVDRDRHDESVGIGALGRLITRCISAESDVVKNQSQISNFKTMIGRYGLSNPDAANLQARLDAINITMKAHQDAVDNWKNWVGQS